MLQAGGCALNGILQPQVVRESEICEGLVPETRLVIGLQFKLLVAVCLGVPG